MKKATKFFVVIYLFLTPYAMIKYDQPYGVGGAMYSIGRRFYGQGGYINQAGLNSIPIKQNVFGSYASPDGAKMIESGLIPFGSKVITVAEPVQPKVCSYQQPVDVYAGGFEPTFGGGGISGLPIPLVTGDQNYGPVDTEFVLPDSYGIQNGLNDGSVIYGSPETYGGGTLTNLKKILVAAPKRRLSNVQDSNSQAFNNQTHHHHLTPPSNKTRDDPAFKKTIEGLLGG